MPWLLYPLLPYVALGVVGRLLNRRKKLLRRAVITLVGSLALLVLTAWLYIPFMHTYFVFYLRMALSMSAIWLGAAAAVFLLSSWLSGVGARPAVAL